jgi:Protein of unknown function (DUF3168)
VIDSTIFTALKGFVPNADGTTFRVFPDVAPENTQRPWITYQAVGGQAANAIDGPADRMNTRTQVNVWADSRPAATALMLQIIAALCVPAIGGLPLGAPVSDYEPDTKLYGSRLDFSIWYLP